VQAGKRGDLPARSSLGLGSREEADGVVDEDPLVEAGQSGTYLMSFILQLQ